MDTAKTIKNIEESQSEGTAIVGDHHGVATVGAFYENYSDYMAMIKAHCLVKFCETQEFNSEEYKAYKKGLTDFIDCMVVCNTENQNKILAN